MTNTIREQWITSDTQLHQWHKDSGKTLAEFIYANSNIIDGVIRYRVECGEECANDTIRS